MLLLYFIKRGNIYLSRFLRDDKYISPDRRKSSNVLIQAFPSDFPPLPEIPLIEIEYPPAYQKNIYIVFHERHQELYSGRCWIPGGVDAGIK